MPVATMKSHDLRSSIGFTPVVELRRLNLNPAVRLLAKLEGNNPGGSVKDRPALFMIEGAGAIQLARRLSSGTIVALLPDRGDRYLSTSLFRSTCGACPP